MNNSPLVSYTKISPNRTSPRNKPIDRITPHCVVGQCSVETLGAIFAPTSKEASSNYGIGYDGRVGMYCEEKDRSWCTSSSANDNRAITIECASDATAPYAFRDAVYESLINLCVDICKRYGKKKLLWLGDKDKTLAYAPAADEMVLTAHRWFANKGCPGDWLYQREADLAAKVTAKLADGAETVKRYTTITGTAKATVGQMRAYIQAKNSKVPNSVLDMIPLYLSEGAAEGIRGDVAFAQSCLETGNFGFAGSAVTPDQNNFCGMGVTANGMKGNDFPGPFVKYINKYLQAKDILTLLSDNRNREIRIIEYATIISHKGYKCFSSVCNGLIGMQVSPNPGTSFERVVVPEGFQSPLADLTMEEQLDYWVAHSVFNNIEMRNCIRSLG